MGYRENDMTHALETDLASGALAEIIADIAEEAARVILPFWRADTAVETKSDASPVTEADRAAEALILKRLAEHWPEVEARHDGARRTNEVMAELACDEGGQVGALDRQVGQGEVGGEIGKGHRPGV